ISEIAMKFSPLTEEQSAKVYEYCLAGILEKYNSLEACEESYFESPRRWKLSVYDHLGEARDFYYDVKSDALVKASHGGDAVAWSTEVSVAKFYGALEAGETLTSMYLRVNDFPFSRDLKEELSMVDIVNDPLIRCLFSGSVSAYQAAQLKRLQD